MLVAVVLLGAGQLVLLGVLVALVRYVAHLRDVLACEELHSCALDEKAAELAAELAVLNGRRRNVTHIRQHFYK